MADMEIKIAVDNTDLIKRAAEQAVQLALEAVGLQAERNAKIECTRAVYNTPESPSYRRTGNLRNAITHDTNGVDTAYVGVNINYAHYVEFGTSKMKPRPFIKPAVVNYTDEYKEIFEYYLENA